MLNTDQDGDKEGAPPSPETHAPETHAPETHTSGADSTRTANETAGNTAPPRPARDESIVEELGAVIDDAKLYATAELAFQKTRAKLLGKNIGVAAGAIVVALILLHIAIIALAVGLVIALEPLVTIWGAIAIVVGVMLLGVAALGYLALARGRVIGEMFASGGNGREDDASPQDTPE